MGDRYDDPVVPDVSGTLLELARYGQAVPMNDRFALIRPRDGGKVLVGEITGADQLALFTEP